MRSIKIFTFIPLLLGLLLNGSSFPDTDFNVYDKANQPVGLAATPRGETLLLEGSDSSNPRDYDPATIVSNGARTLLLFSGLVSYNQQLQLVPEIAESWDISADGTIYTFKIRENAKFQDGKDISAQDFIYSWERAASPKTNSSTAATYLSDIVGVKEMLSGEADHISGLQAVDDHTLQVTIDAPKSYFLYKLVYPTAYVVDKENVESGDDWYKRPNGSGAYRLKEWKPFVYSLYEINPYYYLDSPAIRYITIKQETGSLLSYENNSTDIHYVGLANLERVLDPKEPMHQDLVSDVDLCTGYISFDVNQPPFDDVKVRQAFTLAFDRQKYIHVVLHDASLPAKGLYPPALPGYNTQLKTLDYDPDQAKRLLTESKYGSAAGLPPITFTQGGLGYYVNSETAAMVQMWQQNLGITINIESIDSNNYYDEIYSGNHGQIIGNGWCADYPDPENFADVLFHSGNSNNLSNYSNPDLDKLLEDARVEQDTEKRIQMYQQAEQIIVDDAPALFTTHSLSYQVVKPYIKGYVLTPIDFPFVRYLSIDASLLP